MNGRDPADQRTIKSIAVVAEDVITAYEATTRTGRRTVLCITRPFHGRMRARLHVPGDGEGETGAILIDATDLVDRKLLPAYPDPDHTETEIREDPDREYSLDRHRDRHREAVREWRANARRAIVEEVAIETPDGPHAIDVVALGVE